MRDDFLSSTLHIFQILIQFLIFLSYCIIYYCTKKKYILINIYLNIVNTN